MYTSATDIDYNGDLAIVDGSCSRFGFRDTVPELSGKDYVLLESALLMPRRKR